jgi:hypothetical protein
MAPPTSPGLYWFDGFVNFNQTSPTLEGRCAVLLNAESWVFGFGASSDIPSFRAKVEMMEGEWYGPFECPPWFGDAMIEPIGEDEVESGSGI